MKSRIVAASVLAIAVTVGGGVWATGNADAATAAVQKIGSYFGGKGAMRAAVDNAELAKLLGLTTDELRTELKSGKSLATIAGEKGVSVQAVIDLEVKTLTAALDQRLAEGKITQAEYDTQKAQLATTAANIVNNALPAKGGGLGHSRFEAAVLTNAEIAKLLGLTTDELATALKSGKSLAALAGEKGVTVQSVIDLEKKAIVAALDQQLKDGKLTQAQYDASIAKAADRAAEVVNDIFDGKGGKGHKGFGKGGFGFGVDATTNAELAKLLGMTEDELTTAVKSGKSLATIAGEKSVDVQKVTDLLTAAQTAKLDELLKAGTITQAKYDEEKAGIADRVSDIVNGTFAGKGGHGRGGHGGGRGGHGKFSADGAAPGSAPAGTASTAAATRA